MTDLNCGKRPDSREICKLWFFANQIIRFTVKSVSSFIDWYVYGLWMMKNDDVFISFVVRKGLRGMNYSNAFYEVKMWKIKSK